MRVSHVLGFGHHGRMKEVELKFQVPAEQRAALAAAVAGSAPQPRMRLRAAYWDTPDRALALAGLALRVRREGRIWVQTLKGAGDDGMTRLEHNVPLSRTTFPASVVPGAEPALHAGTPAGERLLAALAHRPVPAPVPALQMQYRTDILRRTRAVKTRIGSVELAFDEGSIQAGGARLPVCELEIELLSGSPLAVINTARGWLPRFGLWLDTRSKAERGDLLSRGETMAPPRAAAPPRLKPDAPVQHARMRVLRHGVDVVCVNASQVASGLHVDRHVHALCEGLGGLSEALSPFAVGANGHARDEGLARSVATMLQRLQVAAERDAPPSPEPHTETAAGVVRSPASQALLLDLLAALGEAAGAAKT